jgi:hypothetical protein
MIDPLIFDASHKDLSQHCSHERKTRLLLHADTAYLNEKKTLLRKP